MLAITARTFFGQHALLARTWIRKTASRRSLRNPIIDQAAISSRLAGLP
jgi:hypothetical protein